MRKIKGPTPISFRLPDWALNQLDEISKDQKRSKNLVARNLFLAQLSQSDDLRLFLQKESEEVTKRQEEQQAALDLVTRRLLHLTTLVFGLIDHSVKSGSVPDSTVKSVFLNGKKIIEANAPSNQSTSEAANV